MIKAETDGPGGDCSTARLTTVPDDNINTQYSNGWNEEENFVRNILAEADDQNNVNVQCFKHADSTTLLPPRTTSKGATSKATNRTDPQTTQPQKVSDDSDAVKSDNVDTKDYQKVDGVKGVLKMAQIIETKDSENDSSRQSSPRNIQVTNLPIKSPNLKTSDA